MEQLSRVNRSSKPVLGTVEVGCPFAGVSSRGNCITVRQFQAAGWHSLIAGARGIIWLQHSFSGPCQDFNTFYDGSTPSSSLYKCQITPGETLHDLVQGVTAFNREVTSLSGVLLSPSATEYVRTSADVSTLTKAYKGACYVFAGSGQPARPPAINQTVRFRLHDRYTGPVVVYGEHRTVPARKGVFRDLFADATAVHIYRIRSASCRRQRT
jgi:hypothetical protein